VQRRSPIFLRQLVCPNCKCEGHLPEPKSLSVSVIGSNWGAESLVDPKLVGETNEVNVLINGKPLHALLDTGSCVSVISHSFTENTYLMFSSRP